MSTIDVLVNLGGAGNVQNMTTITIVDPDYFYGVTDGLDQMWILVTSYLVFFMQAGFALVEAGAVQSKDIISILMKNFTDFAISVLMYWFIGAGFAHGTTSFIGASTTAPGTTDSISWFGTGASSVYSLELNGIVFCATAITIVSGAIACRFSFHAYCALSAVFAGLIYPVTAGWVWGNGFLSFAPNGMQTIDYAGSGVVHLQGGVVSLVACMMVGPRIGRFVKNAEGRLVPSRDFDGSSIVLTSLGTMILWFGWYGFNPGSTLGMSSERYLAAATASMNTTLAACSALLSGLLLTRLFEGNYNFWDVLNCILAGLVGITAPCATISPGWAIFVGIWSALTYQLCSKLILRLGIDDVVGAVSVHGAPGIVGVMSAALFSEQKYVDNAYPASIGRPLNFEVGHQFGVAMIQILATIAWVGVTAFITLKILEKTIGIRVDRDDELVGLDFKYHSGYAYETQNARLQRAKLQIERERILSEKILREQQDKESRESQSGSGMMKKNLRSSNSTNNIHRNSGIQQGGGNVRNSGGPIPPLNAQHSTNGSQQHSQSGRTTHMDYPEQPSSPHRQSLHSGVASSPTSTNVNSNPLSNPNEPYQLQKLPALGAARTPTSPKRSTDEANDNLRSIQEAQAKAGVYLHPRGSVDTGMEAPLVSQGLPSGVGGATSSFSSPGTGSRLIGDADRKGSIRASRIGPIDEEARREQSRNGRRGTGNNGGAKNHI